MTEVRDTKRDTLRMETSGSFTDSVKLGHCENFIEKSTERKVQFRNLALTYSVLSKGLLDVAR